MVNVETVLNAYRRDAEKETAIECLKILHSIGGCDADDEYSRGFDAAIDTAFTVYDIQKKPPKHALRN